MELARKDYQDNNFLKKLRQICNKKIVLIFDECTSGFRENFGDYILKVIHIATFKALGNGYSIFQLLVEEKFYQSLEIVLLAAPFGQIELDPQPPVKFSILWKKQSHGKLYRKSVLIIKKIKKNL